MSPHRIPTELERRSNLDDTVEKCVMASWRADIGGHRIWGRVLRHLLAAPTMLTKPRNDRLAEEVLGRELAEYPGRWVAVTDHKIIAVGDDMAELRTKTIGRRVDRRFRVPSAPGRTLLSRYGG